MRAQSAAFFLFAALWTAGVAPSRADAQSDSSPLSRALRFFDAVTPGVEAGALDALRPPPVSPAARTRTLATLPRDGELQPDAKEAGKLAALEPILRVHQRLDVLIVKVIDLPQAFVGLHERAVVLITRPALRAVTAAELQALVAHEIGHDFFWTEYAAAVERGDRSALQELELRCDGLAVLTLARIGLDPRVLDDATRKLYRFNETIGATGNTGTYPHPSERSRFVRELSDRWSRARGI
jgi:Zn-dependent protease with chaperone function